MGPKKNQNQKMSLGTFLQDESLGSWADEMEDMPLPEPGSRTSYGTDRRAFSSNTGMGMGNAGAYERREYTQREQLPLPDKPPYTAHLANLSFEAMENDVNDFFRDCEVTNVRIVEDKLDRKPKGFGYVEFASLEGLKGALALSGSSLAGRSVRVSVADPPKDRQESRDFSDWTRRGPLPELPNQRRVSDRPGYNKSFDNMSDAGSERGGGRRPFGGADDGKTRDFTNWERRGPLSPVAGTAPALSLREGGRQGSNDGAFRKNSPSWGEGQGRSNEGSRPPRREFQDRPAPERQPTAADMDNQWRTKMKPDQQAAAESPEPSAPSSPAPAAAPVSRPRLNLQKRTVAEAPSEAQSAGADSKASPFGAARPVDTAAKEREVAEKRQLAIRQKREADEKAKADRNEEKKQAREKGEKEEADRKDSKAPKEDDEHDDQDGDPAAPQIEVLQRADATTNDMIADDDENENDEEIGQAEDKAVKPREIVRNPPTKANGAWRKGPATPTENSTTTTTTTTTTETLEEDGWSTVPKGGKPRNKGRNNNAASRAIAS